MSAKQVRRRVSRRSAPWLSPGGRKGTPRSLLVVLQRQGLELEHDYAVPCTGRDPRPTDGAPEAFDTRPERRQRVQTSNRRAPPAIFAWTRCRFVRHSRLLLLFAWLTLWPTERSL